MAILKKVKIYVEEKTVSDGSGRKFKSYKAVTKNGVKVTCKFRKEVKDVPTETCYLHVYDNRMNMQKNAEYPTLWISEIEKVEPITSAILDEEANAREIAEIFG